MSGDANGAAGNPPELTARGKYTCPACAAEAVWNPAKKALVCPYCGTESPAELAADGRGIREHDLAEALRGLDGDKRGWAAAKKSVRCQSCQAISVLDPERAAQRCDFCGSAQLVAYEEMGSPVRPESMLPFKVAETQVREQIRRWYGSHWFAPGKLAKAALTDTLRGVYLPYWTFDAHAEADWTAEAGHYYYESRTVRGPDGKTRTEQVRNVRWVPASGHVSGDYDDELVCASRGADAALLRQIEPFPTAELVPYDPGYAAGWVVEHYQIDLLAAARHAREVMERKVESACAADVPGDTHRSLDVRAVFSGQTFKHILAPVWLLTYTYGAKTFHVLVNGYTGRIAGRYPLSWIKIALASLAVLAVVAVFVLLASR
jgi:DNA-directed RNA polymerase subunit RPC12/RpoP